ncbi:neutral zinc metallopeptidase [Terricaulis sp.]|uniref:KPN_02809 family neutral zinc metallopeptidase n=1 Tax=Terricaulis sp. TaxID=2768686 RepID=UPI0037836DF4
MRMDNQRESSNFEDRGRGGGGGGGGIGGLALFGLLRMLGPRGMIVALLALGAIFIFNPLGLRDAVLGGGTSSLSSSGGAGGSTCDASPTNQQACHFARQVLASTEDVWAQQFSQGRLPRYGVQVGGYVNPTLVAFSDRVSTGCGEAPSSVGPFYCPADSKLYLDPTFYEVMAQRLNAPGDFAQAYVIAHEVGHHIQNLIGSSSGGLSGETENQTSVRRELQADCFAGVWGHTAQTQLAIDDSDLREALNAAHQIGDDTLQSNAQGQINPAQFTHGTSAQRMRWFRRGFDTGDARQCDTFAVSNYGQL